MFWLPYGYTFLAYLRTHILCDGMVNSALCLGKYIQHTDTQTQLKRNDKQCSLCSVVCSVCRKGLTILFRFPDSPWPVTPVTDHQLHYIIKEYHSHVNTKSVRCLILRIPFSTQLYSVIVFSDDDQNRRWTLKTTAFYELMLHRTSSLFISWLWTECKRFSGYG